jgi:hypothetical protein
MSDEFHLLCSRCLYVTICAGVIALALSLFVILSHDFFPSLISFVSVLLSAEL